MQSKTQNQHSNLMMPELKIQRISAAKSRRSISSVYADHAEDLNENTSLEVSPEPVKKRSKSKDLTKASKTTKPKKAVSPEKRRITRSRTRSKSPSRSKAPTNSSSKTSRGAKLYIKKDLEKEPLKTEKESTPVKEIPTNAPTKRVLRSASNMSSTSDLSLKLDESLPSGASEEKVELISAKLNDSKLPLKVEKDACNVAAFLSCGYLKCSQLFNILIALFILMIILASINHLNSNSDIYSDKMDIYLNSFKGFFANMKTNFIGLKAKF